MKTGLYISLLVLAAVTSANCKVHPNHGQSKSKDAKSRIINGKEATVSQFPWQVCVRKNSGICCSGSIISEYFVLSAGDCVGHSGNYDLVFGSLDESTDNPGAVRMKFRRRILPPGYDDLFEKDIALLQLATPLSWSSSIQPIRLPTRSQLSNTFLGETVEVSGWGSPLPNEYEKHSPVLLWTDAKVISNEDCSKYYEDEFGDPNIVSPSHICTLSDDGKTLCAGDAGDSLVWQDPADGNWTLVGIGGVISRECLSNAPDFYTRVTSHMEWISHMTDIPIS